jgi:hypothetical protein
MAQLDTDVREFPHFSFDQAITVSRQAHTCSIAAKIQLSYYQREQVIYQPMFQYQLWSVRCLNCATKPAFAPTFFGIREGYPHPIYLK